MTRIIRGGQANALDGIQTAQRHFREQISALTDAVRQLGGHAEIGAGAVINDPLNAPYVLWVNFYTGSDTFVSGSYSTSGTATERIELQRLECGYTPSRPFKTLSRAIIELGIITAKSFYQAPLGNNDLVSIVLMPGASTVLNGPGSVSVLEWENGKEPSDAELQAFNPANTGGIILPRGCSVVAMSSDLRKTIIRPQSVPTAADEAADCSNRRAIFKITGTGYYWGLTFMDKVGSTSSHHLLHCFEFASQAELDEFYGKIRAAFAGPANTGGLDPALAVTRNAEFEIVGPRPASGSQTINTDTTVSASPYIYNCSIRSNYGLCGVYGDGAKTSGFRSIVLAQFTGVSLQRDLSCWQKYNPAQSPLWGNYFTNYADYINTDPDDVRMHPARRSFHIRAVNDAIMQEVSVFAIGQGIHHWTQSGGELTITNSNSNFGGCAALAEGYKSTAYASDRNWNVGTIRVATNLSEKRNNIRKIFLGTVAETTADNATNITLTTTLAAGLNTPGQPLILDRDGYSLVPGSYLWIENLRGEDYRAQLTASPWSATNADRLVVSTPFQNENGVQPGATFLSDGVDTGQTWPSLAGARVYVRRLQDSRTADERKFSLRCNNTAIRTRTPVRDYVLQTTLGQAGIAGAIPEAQLLVVASAASIAPEGSGVNRSAAVEIRRVNAVNTWISGGFYRIGDAVRHLSKSWSCKKQNSDIAFDLNKWEQTYAHMEDTYRPEDFWKNSQPSIIFDNDTDSLDATVSCGYDLTTVWATDQMIQRQYRSGVDYQGVHSLLVSLGFSAANAHTLLLPRLSTSRERNPNSALDGIGAPSGAANSWNNWAIEFRRPSNIRLFGHAWEWSGFLNYTKALPEYQLELSPVNKFTYYFTNKNGGRVYGSGFNEEGYLITPQGLQDLATGNEITFENIGDRDIPIDEIEFPASYQALTVGSLAVTSGLNLNTSIISGKPTWGSAIDPFGDVLPALPASSTSRPGIVRLATLAQARALVLTDRAVTPSGLGGVVTDIFNRLALMQDSESYLYVDGGVSYSGGAASYSSIPAAIWNDIRANRSIHKISNWSTVSIAPGSTSAQYDFVKRLIFSDIKQAYDFIANRNPISADTIRIFLYGPSYANQASFVTNAYAGTATILMLPGTSATLETDGWTQEHCTGRFQAPNATLEFRSVNINISGTQQDPNYRSNTTTGIVSNNISIINSRIKHWVTNEQGYTWLGQATNDVSYRAATTLTGKNKNVIDFDYVKSGSSSSIGSSLLFSCNRAFIASRQPIPATVDSNPFRFELLFKVKNVGVTTDNFALFVPHGSVSVSLGPVGLSGFSSSAFTFNFSGSNGDAFIFVRTGQQFSTMDIAVGDEIINRHEITVASPGSAVRFYSLNCNTPVALVRGLNVTPITPIQSPFLYRLAKRFSDAGIGAANSYLWSLPVGSWRFGTFFPTSSDIVTVQTAEL